MIQKKHGVFFLIWFFKINYLLINKLIYKLIVYLFIHLFIYLFIYYILILFIYLFIQINFQKNFRQNLKILVERANFKRLRPIKKNLQKRKNRSAGPVKQGFLFFFVF